MGGGGGRPNDYTLIKDYGGVPKNDYMYVFCLGVLLDDLATRLKS